MKKVISFFRSDIVFTIALIAAILSVVLTPLSKEYFSYIDFKVLALLMSLMLIVEGFKSVGTFEVLSHAFLSKVGSIRTASLTLVVLCFFIAMAVTNDVALITMVPFTMAVMDFCTERRIVFLIVMETVAANLGSMLTPIGNPQNLYLFSFYNLEILEFLKITLPTSLLSLVIIIIVILLVKSRKINIVFDVDVKIEDKKRFSAYIIAFIFCILTVVGIIPYQISFLATIAIVFISKKELFRCVDYGLLCTFIFFFIFVGNISNYDVAANYIQELLVDKEFIIGISASQIISNVPAAVLLSSFTDNYKDLILGTNIGGLGTMIASLASLISWKFYCKRTSARKCLYFIMFTGINLGFLFILIMQCIIFIQ